MDNTIGSRTPLAKNTFGLNTFGWNTKGCYTLGVLGLDPGVLSRPRGAALIASPISAAKNVTLHAPAASCKGPRKGGAIVYKLAPL